MMDLLARLDPGDSVTRVVLVALVQMSVVVVLAELIGRTLLRQRADARHGLWLGALVWVLISPAVVAVADRSGLVLWVIALPLPAPGTSPAVEVLEIPRLDSTLLTADEASGPAPVEAVPMPRDEPGEPEAHRPSMPEVSQRSKALVGGVVLLWGLGALAGFARILAGWRRLAALTRTTRPLDPERHGPTLERVRDALGVAAVPPVVTSAMAAGPVAVGLFRPIVVLPEGLAESISSESLRDVLVHECAHVFRLDPWIGLLQCLAGALFWPHPLVHYLNGQLTRAREEVCDNHVLRCGDPRGYARTLLALTERCRPLGVARPGLGLLGARWTLADRVAGVLDPRRVPMTCTSIHMKIALALALTVTGLTVAFVRLDRPARADEPKTNQAQSNAIAPAGPKAADWSVEGTVVDEQNRPVSGAVVHSREEGDPAGSKTAADGTFALGMGNAPLYTRELVAESDGGARLGVVRFQPPRHLGATEPVRIVLKPARLVKVRVNDATGAPVAGAPVEAFEYAYQYEATTGPDGVATPRVPADARISAVIGHKSGVGFDFFENYRATPPSPEFSFPPLPAEVTLTLDGAITVKFKVHDSNGQPVAGAVIVPFRPMKRQKIQSIDVTHGATTRATTDAQGVAVFDWLPKDLGGLTFFVQSSPATKGLYPAQNGLRYVKGGSTELTIRLVRRPRLSGTVRLADGRPARQILVVTSFVPAGWLPNGARTDDEGRYVFENLVAGHPRMVYVQDESWVAPTRTSDVLQEGQEQGGLDFTLAKGTLIHGRVTVEPDHRPSAGTNVSLVDEGGPLPKEFRTVSRNTYQLRRRTSTDAQGRFQFRAAPGRYTLVAGNRDRAEALTIEVKNEAEIVRDLTTEGPVKRPVGNSLFSGVVIEKTINGDRPVNKAWVFRWPVLGRAFTDEAGSFQMERSTGGETMVYAFFPDKGLAGFATVSADADNVKLVLAQTGTVTGRVIDSNRMPWAKQRLRIELAEGTYLSSSAHFAVSAVMTDDQGRFIYKDGPVGSTGEISAFHQKDGPLIMPDRNRGPRTVVAFEIRDLEPVAVPDLVIPVEKSAK